MPQRASNVEQHDQPVAGRRGCLPAIGICIALFLAAYFWLAYSLKLREIDDGAERLSVHLKRDFTTSPPNNALVIRAAHQGALDSGTWWQIDVPESQSESFLAALRAGAIKAGGSVTKLGVMHDSPVPMPPWWPAAKVREDAFRIDFGDFGHDRSYTVFRIGISVYMEGLKF